MDRPKFSQRMGYKSVRVLQFEEMGEELRNRLWNRLQEHFWDKYSRHSDASFAIMGLPRDHEIYELASSIWGEFFKRPLDSLSSSWLGMLQRIRQHFFECEWYEVYDLVEFLAVSQFSEKTGDFMAAINRVLQSELSAYRFVDGIIAPIISQTEITSIEDAIEAPQQGPRTHIRRALELLSDKHQPDYRNSIKESISAVEALCKQLTGEEAATLSRALKSLKGDVRLHPALRSAFESLYGYAGDAGGVRHALLDASEVGFDEAKFMLVACSAFVNFLNSKFGLSNTA